MIKKFGFTLTEMLVTLSIVGVIAAMTVPTLMSKYQKEAQTVQIRKASQEFANAIDMYITAEGKKSLAATKIFDDGGLEDFIDSNLKVVKECDANDASCFASNYRSIDNTKNSAMSCKEKSYVLANSAVICVTTVTRENSVVEGPNGQQGWLIGTPFLTINMDTNGTDKPNIGGRDMFTFYITRQGELLGVSPASLEADPGYDASNNNWGGQGNPISPVDQTTCTNSPLGEKCLYNLMRNGWKMDY